MSINSVSVPVHKTPDAGQVSPLRQKTPHQCRVLSFETYPDIKHAYLNICLNYALVLCGKCTVTSDSRI